MLSKSQEQEINNRVKKVVTEFLSNDMTIVELSYKIHIPSSTIQRDLNNQDRIKFIFKDDYVRVNELIQNKLVLNKINGLREGGINSTTINEPIRSEDGRFIGNIKK